MSYEGADPGDLSVEDMHDASEPHLAPDIVRGAESIGPNAPRGDWSGALVSEPAGNVQFAHYQAMARAMNDGQLTFESWGKLALANPVVKAALDAAEKEERLRRTSGGSLRCDACLTAGGFGTFEWAGALFIHLLTCQKFAATIE